MDTVETKLRHLFLCFIIFLCGIGAAFNLSYLLYDIPEHYNGTWLDVVYCIIIAIIVSAMGYANTRATD